MFDLCECLMCKECNGIDVDRINFNLFKCNEKGHILYRYNSTSLIEISLLYDDKWIDRVKL